MNVWATDDEQYTRRIDTHVFTEINHCTSIRRTFNPIFWLRLTGGNTAMRKTL